MIRLREVVRRPGVDVANRMEGQVEIDGPAEIQAAAVLLSRYGQDSPVKIRGRKVLTASGKTTVAAAATLGWFFLETTR